jgi:hypothetical protein
MAAGLVREYDKLIMSRHVLRTFYHLDERAGQDSVFYSGDSENDAPMFAGFRHTLGMSTLRHQRASIPALPAWISQGPGETVLSKGWIKYWSTKERAHRGLMPSFNPPVAVSRHREFTFPPGGNRFILVGRFGGGCRHSLFTAQHPEHILREWPSQQVKANA